jgi:gluconate kinase
LRVVNDDNGRFVDDEDGHPIMRTLGDAEYAGQCALASSVPSSLIPAVYRERFRHLNAQIAVIYIDVEAAWHAYQHILRRLRHKLYEESLVPFYTGLCDEWRGAYRAAKAKMEPLEEERDRIAAYTDAAFAR